MKIDEFEMLEKLIMIKKAHEDQMNAPVKPANHDGSPIFKSLNRMTQEMMNEYDITIAELEECITFLEDEDLEDKVAEMFPSTGKGSKKKNAALCDLIVYGFKEMFEGFIEDYTSFKSPRFCKCIDCDSPYTIDNPQWFVNKVLQLPKRCPDCIALKKLNRAQAEKEASIGNQNLKYIGSKPTAVEKKKAKANG